MEEYLQYDGLTGSFDEIEVFRNETCTLHGHAKQNKNRKQVENNGG